MEETVVLGEVTCPSGELVLMDGGYLSLWSGDRSPDEGPRPGPAVDFEVVGVHADVAARSFDRQSGRRLYDIPDHGVEKFTAAFAEHCREHGLDASLQRFPRQVPHRERVRHAVTSGDPDFLIFGVPVILVGNVPDDRPLLVTATHGDWGWAQIRIGLRDGATVETRQMGTIYVDHARFVFGDANALNSWIHDDPIDGLADVVFWGKDQAEVAAEFDASRTGTAGEDNYGWLNLPVREAYQRAVALEERRKATPPRMFAFDFRPHSHHWQVMAGVRASHHEAATVTVGGADIMMAMTSIGDGSFPVHLDIDAAGAPTAITITITINDVH